MWCQERGEGRDIVVFVIDPAPYAQCMIALGALEVARWVLVRALAAENPA